MRRWKANAARWTLGILAAGMLVPAWAHPGDGVPSLPATIVTDPPDARIYIGTSSGLQYQGQAGTTFYVAENLLHKGDTCQFTLKRAGFKDQLVVIPAYWFDNNLHHWPISGSIALEPDRTTWAWWCYEATRLAPWALGLGAGMVGLFLGLRPLWSRLSGQLERARRLETLHSIVLENLADRSLEGAVLGTWRLVERIGQGGMATVYRAVPDETLDQNEARAVKVVKKEFSHDEEFRERFRREFEASSRLVHPGIIQVYESGEHPDGYLYFFMEFLKGRTLREVLQADHAIPEARAIDYLAQIMTAVSVAHDKQIVHRDLKPENVMVLDNGRLKVMDFGLAKRMQQTIKVTATGALLGTPAYMAPEQISGAPLNPRSDQYAIGVMAYELLGGRLPFDDQNITNLLFRRLYEDPPRLKTLCPTLSDGLESAIHRMLARDPQARFATLGDALASLSPAPPARVQEESVQ